MSSASAEGPRLARATDFSGILDLVDRCFSHSAGGMAAEWCHVYDEAQPERHGVICEDGQVVSHVSIVEDELAVGDGSVQCWGISGVATDPRYRGRGHMTTLVDFWTKRMNDEGVPLAKLGGDRRRYGRWGWEQAGRERRYCVSSRYFDAGPGADITVERFDGSNRHLERLRDLYRTKRYRVRRTPEQWRTRLGRVQFETLLTSGTDPDAYLVFQRTRRNSGTARVSEVAGDPRGIRALFSHVIEAFDRETIQVNVHATDPLNGFLGRPDVSGSWQSRAIRMIRLNDLPAVLAAYAEELSARLRTTNVAPERVSLGVAGDEGGAELDWDGQHLSVAPVSITPDIELDRMAMTRVLMGDPVTVEAYDTHPLLDAVTPLGFYVPLLDRV